MGLFSRKEKQKPQIVDINNEINRIAKLMFEYEDRIDSIVADKILISERDYNVISKGLSKIISEVVTEQGQSLPQHEVLKTIIKGQNIVSRIIDKLYNIDWIY